MVHTRKSAKPPSALQRLQKPRGRRSPLVDELHEYSQSDLTRLFGLPGALLSALEAAGFIARAQSEGRTSYNFQDLLMLRMASALRSARIPASKIPLALGKVRAALPPESVMTTMALAAADQDQASRQAAQGWDAASPQDVPTSSKAAMVSRVTSLAAVTRMRLAASHYSRGHALEESDVTAARAAYLEALKAHSGHLEARINLGRLLHMAGELAEAEKVYRQAKSTTAMLSYNLAILLEDMGRDAEAVAAYRDALAQDPLLHDAHFNLSRLHEKSQRPREALRHLLAYKRHIARFGE